MSNGHLHLRYTRYSMPNESDVSMRAQCRQGSTAEGSDHLILKIRAGMNCIDYNLVMARFRSCFSGFSVLGLPVSG